MIDVSAQIDQSATVKTGFPLRGAVNHVDGGDSLLVQMKDVSKLGGVDWGKVIKINTNPRKEPDWLQNDDVLFAGKGSPFFAVHLSDIRPRSLASPHFQVLRINDKTKFLPAYLAWYLNSKAARKYFATNQEGSTSLYISNKVLSSFSIAVPEIKTQKLIADTAGNWQAQRQLLKDLIINKETLIEGILDQHLYKGN